MSLNRSGAAAGAFCLVLFIAPEITHAGTYRVLHAFDPNNGDGESPIGLIRDSQGNLFGTTFSSGGDTPGAIFKIAPDGTETVLHIFGGGPDDGAFPNAALILDAAGNLYGTATDGGARGSGAVFEFTASGEEKLLYSFCRKLRCRDGSDPSSTLMRDSAGNFYGTTSSGGAHLVGTVFKLAPDGTETVLHAFGGRADGSQPYGVPIMDRKGNLYGVTAGGGGPERLGTVFKLTPDGKEEPLYSFVGGTDGARPQGGVIADRDGNLYGTTLYGGGGPCARSLIKGCGTVFELNSDGTETVLHTFAGGADGAYPYAGLILDGDGNLYGTTSGGGMGTGCNEGCGTIFRIAPDGTETVLHTFTNATGATPYGGVIRDKKGNLYGTASAGGANNAGVVFELRR